MIINMIIICYYYSQLQNKTCRSLWTSQCDNLQKKKIGFLLRLGFWLLSENILFKNLIGSKKILIGSVLLGRPGGGGRRSWGGEGVGESSNCASQISFQNKFPISKIKDFSENGKQQTAHYPQAGE